MPDNFFPDIDEETKTAINSYSLSQLYGKSQNGGYLFDAFRHELIQEGVDAVIHGCLFKVLEESRSKSQPLRDFIVDFDLRFPDTYWGHNHFTVPLNKIEKLVCLYLRHVMNIRMQLKEIKIVSALLS